MGVFKHWFRHRLGTESFSYKYIQCHVDVYAIEPIGFLLNKIVLDLTLFDKFTISV